MSSSLSTPARPGPSSASSRVSETPLKQNMSSTKVFMDGTLEEQKEAVRTDLGPIPEVTVDFMLAHILPKSNVDVLKTMDILKENNVWSQQTGRWKVFEGLSPNELGNKATGSDTKTKETEVFSRLKDVYDNIIHYTEFKDGGKRAPTLRFSQLPNVAPASDTDVRTKPDCCGILTEAQEICSSHEKKPSLKDTDPQYKPKKSNRQPGKNISKPNWFDISYVEEYKLADSVGDLNDNIWKILWSLHHMMNVDHRRRFTFGLTIENETTRIWFCCRQIVLVSQPFNFSKDASRLVHLISSLAYATTTQLGYDPTMVLRWRNGWQYDITLVTQGSGTDERVQVYKTIRIISDTAYNIRGRATRVYEAEIGDVDYPFTGRRVVLKDSWIDASRPKEGDTLANLLKGASDDEKRLFLTIFQHGTVQIGGMDDTTQGLILNGQIIDIAQEEAPLEPTNPLLVNERTTSKFKGPPVVRPPAHAKPASTHMVPLFPLYHFPITRSAASESSTNTSGASSRGKSSDALAHNTYRKLPKPIVYSPKVHYRIVFEEVGESLMSMAESGKARLPIVDQALHDAVLALKFMAKKGYVHRDISAGNILICNDKHARLADLEYAKEYGAESSSYIRTGTYSFMAGEVAKGQYSFNPLFRPFAHNPIHDLESLWWVAVWCTMWHYPVPQDKELNADQLEHVASMVKHGKRLFPTYYDSNDSTRINEILDTETYAQRGQTKYPEPVLAFLVRLHYFKQCIAWAYKKIERKLPRTKASYFTDVLRIADPHDNETDDESDSGDEDANLSKDPANQSVHDMIISKLDWGVTKYPVPDMLLWPLGSIKHHAEWVKQQNTRKKLRRQHVEHAYIHIDA